MVRGKEETFVRVSIISNSPILLRISYSIPYLGSLGTLLPIFSFAMKTRTFTLLAQISRNHRYLEYYTQRRRRKNIFDSKRKSHLNLEQIVLGFKGRANYRWRDNPRLFLRSGNRPGEI